MMAIGQMTVEQFFAGLYGNPNIEQEPMSAGRQMGGHFATHSLNEDGSWKDLTKQKIQRYFSTACQGTCAGIKNIQTSKRNTQ
jgi:hypothetical protein